MNKNITTYQLGTFIGYLKTYECKRLCKEDLKKLEEINNKFSDIGKIDNPVYVEYVDDCMERFCK